jgi:hypothetical protein
MHINDRFRRVRHRRGRSLRRFALAGLLWAGPAIAAPPARVLALPGGPDEAAAASLAEVLRIQMGEQGSVSVGDALTGSNLSARVHEAIAALDRMDASLCRKGSPCPTTVADSREGMGTLPGFPYHS